MIVGKKGKRKQLIFRSWAIFRRWRVFRRRWNWGLAVCQSAASVERGAHCCGPKDGQLSVTGCDYRQRHKSTAKSMLNAQTTAWVCPSIEESHVRRKAQVENSSSWYGWNYDSLQVFPCYCRRTKKWCLRSTLTRWKWLPWVQYLYFEGRLALRQSWELR